MALSIGTVFLHSADTDHTSTRLGKARAAVPQEYELAEFMKEVRNPDPSWNESNTACHWWGTRCGEDGFVESLTWWNSGYLGILRWKYAPTTLSRLNLHNNHFSGSIEMEYLPRNLAESVANANSFTGNLNLTDLPRSLKKMSAYMNECEGRLDLLHLPHGFEYLDLHQNKFSGDLNLSRLPNTMKFIDFYHNELDGSVCFDNLPMGLSQLTLASNPKLKGSYSVKSLPPKLYTKSLGLFSFSYQRKVKRFDVFNTLLTEFQ